jgi:hypothetical protein
VWVHFSHDDGRTWPEAAVLSDDHRGETAILRMRSGRWLAAARVERGPDEKTPAWGLGLFDSADEGRTWNARDQVTAAKQHPGHLLQLADGRVLLTFGMRDVGAIGMRVSDDEGRTWGPLEVLQKLDGGDLGYPATVETADGTLVTAYYYSKPAYHMGVVRWRLAGR